MALPCPLLSSQDHCMNLDHPCNLDPIFLSYKAFNGMVPQYVKNWPECKEQVFGRELHFSRESKRTLQGQMRTENLSPQDHFRAILRFHQHRYLREGWHTECWPLLESHQQQAHSEKPQAGNGSILLQISAPCAQNNHVPLSATWTTGFWMDWQSAARQASSPHGPQRQTGLNGSITQL